jgi:ribosomal protein S18 acetylase RimI-like enzyme
MAIEAAAQEPAVVMGAPQEAWFETIVRVNTDAFCDAPMYRYFFPDDAQRHQACGWLLRRSLRMKYWNCLSTATGNGEGICWWFRPGERPYASLWQNMKVGFWQIPFQFGLQGLRRMEECNSHINQILDAAIGGKPHWILDMIAVAPTLQGKGIGGGLMRPVFELADRDGLPCYVMTHNPRNLAFYRRYGFELDREVPSPSTGLTAYGLRRPPQKRS